MLTFLLLMKHIFVNVFNMCLAFIKIQYAAVKALSDLIRRPTHLGKAQGQREVGAGRRGSSISVQPARYCCPHDGMKQSPAQVYPNTYCAAAKLLRTCACVFQAPTLIITPHPCLSSCRKQSASYCPWVPGSTASPPPPAITALKVQLETTTCSKTGPTPSDHCCAPPQRQVPGSETLSALFPSCVAFCLMLRFQVDCQLVKTEK